MYDFHYNFIKKINVELLFMDTDILSYEIKSKNVYDEFFKWKDLLEFSNNQQKVNEKILSFCDFVNFFVIKKHHLKN